MIKKEIDWDAERAIWDRTDQRIEKHHYIYDDNDKSLYTTEMTHINHLRLHVCLKKEGIEIPHVS